MTQISTTSRNDDFAIEVIAGPASEGAHSQSSEAIGRIMVGEFTEQFTMDLGFWTVDDYRRSWSDALTKLEEADDSTSCLIASITDPMTSNFIFCWPLYRDGKVVHVQHSIVFVDKLREQFNPQEPWQHVEARSLVDEDGNRISEWATSISQVRRFQESIGSR